MMPERWQRIEALYHAVCARPADARAAFITEICGEDKELRHELESLLNEPLIDDGFLGPPALAHAAAQMVSDLAPEANVGRTIGAYVSTN